MPSTVSCQLIVYISLYYISLLRSRTKRGDARRVSVDRDIDSGSNWLSGRRCFGDASVSV
ncbi:hypothetical protein ASPZODRAFT_740608 [Penicilliopsis zonata CBS 506.65]|uniref:Uncharacterized protein n=1 Tax=Penicilliopsis zonata CBS 506.65 TaxID=1073090 RepID=A0A1L9SC68_9EURO|nr:hypothetical protein ASPZODRAFT_740608 [Penicilliopsis zonata CBS 506.65]OJJ44800.1 hypothetical protein ASPZODRAFT_740608 [Penicilliopsis zonata CBS 506.65]